MKNQNSIIGQGLESLKQEDLKAVWIMRNDELVCRFAQSNNPVSWQEFESVFKYTDYPKLVFKTHYSDGNATTSEVIGYVDFRNDMIDDNNDIKEWSFFIAPEHRGKGWSKIMLEEAIDWAKEQGYNSIRGVVKQANEASHSLHEQLGFQVQKETNDEVIYILNLTT